MRHVLAAAEEGAGEPLYDRLLEILHALLSGQWAVWMRGEKASCQPARSTLCMSHTCACIQALPYRSLMGHMDYLALLSKKPKPALKQKLLCHPHKWLTANEYGSLGSSCCDRRSAMLQANLREVPPLECRTIQHDLSGLEIAENVRRDIQAALNTAPPPATARQRHPGSMGIEAAGWQLPAWDEHLQRLSCLKQSSHCVSESPERTPLEDSV